MAAARRLGSSISVSYFLRTARASASIDRASSIIGSLAASTAALPPSNSFLRASTSFSLVPLTSSYARSRGDLPASTRLTNSLSAPI